jgi:hypothetical protein
MKTASSICFVTAILLASATLTFADIARPKPSPLTEPRVVLHTSLTIEPDMKGYEAKLQIRQSDLQLLRAALDSMPGDSSLAASVTNSPARTMVAGLLLFISISFAGVWIARAARAKNIGRGYKTVAVIIVAAATLGAAAIITRGNAGPPGYYNWRNLPTSLTKGEPTAGGLDIEIMPDAAVSGTSMKLIIPLRKQTKPGDEE